jgi:DNA polymerase elongation subunit (family B)
MYPAIIMSLNISPETKIAKVNGWDNMLYKTGKDFECKIDLVSKVLNLNKKIYGHN